MFYHQFTIQRFNMSELDNAISKINEASTRANNTTTFFDNVVSGEKDQTFINPNNGKNSKSVKGILDEAYQADKPDLQVFVDDCKAEVVNAKDQADIATNQAAAAAQSASQASQIAGLDTLASGVGLLSPRFDVPDFLCSFNNGLRVEHGYTANRNAHGEPVIDYQRLSGATSINKSGQQVTLADNEPAIESEGVALFESLTNFVFISEKSNWTDGSGGTTGVQVENTDPQTKTIISTVNSNTRINRRPYFSNTLTIGNTYTVSFRAKIDGGEIKQVAGFFTGVVFPSVIPNEWHTYTFSGVATSTALDFLITGKCEIAYIQCVEGNIPNAPYIPTNGAAATRAADVAKVTGIGNLPAPGKPLYCIFDIKAQDNGNWGSFFRSKDSNYGLHLYRANNNTYQLTAYEGLTGLFKTLQSEYKDTARVIIYSNGLVAGMYVNGNKAGEIQLNNPITYVKDQSSEYYIGSTSGSNHFVNGHIKNITFVNGVMTDDLAKSYGVHPNA